MLMLPDADSPEVFVGEPEGVFEEDFCFLPLLIP
jgi:hypothetical protein